MGQERDLMIQMGLIKLTRVYCKYHLLDFQASWDTTITSRCLFITPKQLDKKENEKMNYRVMIFMFRLGKKKKKNSEMKRLG